jgi:hypothetical protein
VRLTRRGRRVRAAAVALAVAGALAGLAAALGRAGGPVVVERCTVTLDGVAHRLDPEQAGNAATIAAVAVRRGLPARAATIGIATAVQESSLRNLDHGDRDSLGLFQQRPSQGWGTPEQVMDPIYAANAFYDVLVGIEGYESLEVTDASDRVQRSAFPQAVADHEPLGRAWASALTGFSPAALTCRLRGAASPGDPAVVEDLLARDLGEAAPPLGEAEERDLVLPVGTEEAGAQRAWVLAHWAVTQADRLGLDAVATQGRRWRRDDPAAGWAEAADAVEGEVRLTLAAP